MKLLNKVKYILPIIFFMTLVFTTKSFAVTGVITEITVNLREKPTTDSKKIMYVTQDDVVEVLEKDGDWYKIKFKNSTGYVFGEYLKVDDSKIQQATEKIEEPEENTEPIDTKKEETITKEEQTQISSNNKETEKAEKESEIKEEVVNNTNLIIKSKTQIRIVPNISSSVIYTAKKDIKIDVVEQLKDWSYINVNGICGWVRTDKIVEENEVSADKAEKVETKTAYIKYSSVNLRKKASTTSTVLAKLKLNEEVTVLEEISAKWSKVEVDGLTGYISTELLADKKQEEIKQEKTETETTSRDGETTSREEKEKKEDKKTEETSKNEEVNKKNEDTKSDSNTTTKKDEVVKEDKKESSVTSASKKEESTSKVTGEDIVEYAKKFLGYDYVYGGASPKAGFDCSGLTYYVYKHFGYTLSRSSKAQATNGKEVAKSNLKPGDLIIYKNTSLTAIGHVGIYIGDNKMIHASEPGVGVIITDIDAKSYKYPQRYVTARRII